MSSNNPQPKQSSLKSDIEEILNQYIVFGQKQQPFSCARCGAQTDDKDQNFCWCTDRDSSASASSPTWIDNVNYPRYAKAKDTATQALLNKIENIGIEARIDELDNLPWKRADKYGINSPYVTKEWLLKRKNELRRTA